MGTQTITSRAPSSALVKLNDGQTVTVPAWPVAGSGELVVTPYADSKTITSRGWWGITHARSGMKLSGYYVSSRARALEAARDIDRLANFAALNDQGTNALDVFDRETREAIMRRWEREAPRSRKGTAPVRASVAPSEYRPTGDDMREAAESFLPDGWELYDGDPFGDLLCPCGYRIEQDGVCPDGCRSPMPI